MIKESPRCSTSHFDADQINWATCPPDAQLAKHSIYNISVDDCPHYLLFHADKCHPHDLLNSTNLSPIDLSDDYLIFITNKAQLVLNKIRDCLEATNSLQQKYQHSKSKTKPL